MKPAAMRTVAGDAGTGNLGESVDVVRGDAGDLLDFGPDLVRPGLCAEDAVPEFRVTAEVDPQLLCDRGEMEEVARRAAYDRDAEVLHEHDLLLGVPRAGRQDGAAELLGAVVRAEAAGEEPVAVGDLDDVVCRYPVHGQAPGDAVRPHGDVVGRLRNADRLARRS